jgi:hypothetical protein
LSSLVLLARLPIGHGQKKTVVVIAVLRHLIGLLEILDRGLEIAGPPQGNAQVTPMVGILTCEVHRRLSMDDRLLRVA